MHLGLSLGIAANNISAISGSFVFFESVTPSPRSLNIIDATGSADDAIIVTNAIQSASIVNGDLVLTYDDTVITSVAMTNGELIVTYGA